jgi:hypothetical protein
MFRTPYLVRIKVLIFNHLKIFNSLLSFLMTVGPPSFLVNPLPTSVYSIYKPLILDGFLKFWCFSLDFARMDTKLPLFFPYSCCRFLVRRGVFILYNFSYLHLNPISFKCIILFNQIQPSTLSGLFIMSLIISPKNLY